MRPYQPANYSITVEGILDDRWSDCMGSMTISVNRHKNQGEMTTLVGRVKDQAELFGLLNTLYELHLPLISVQSETSD
jgi:hypothetical protein